jgi:hypothetical protein
MIPFTLSKAHISCPYGTISVLKEENFGVNTFKQEIRDACKTNETLFQNAVCSNFPYKKDISDWFNKHCQG